MADLPRATTTVDDEAGALASGSSYLVIMAAVAQNADAKPRVFSSTKALLTKHAYAPGVDYAAMHFDEVGAPVIFVGMPIVTAGAIGQQDTSGNTGTSAVTIAAGSDGVLEETDGSVTVLAGGVVGTDQIKLSISLDGGRTSKTVRLGTATTYTIPYVGLVLSFTDGGTLVADDVVLTWRSTAPRWDSDGLADARTALAAQQKSERSWLVVGDLTSSQDASDVLTQINGYETSNDRFKYARAQVRDSYRAAKKSRLHVAMTGSPKLSFLEVGATGDTITRDGGSWLDDGFAANDLITVTGSVSNNITHAKIASLTDTVITLDTADLVTEASVEDCVVKGSKPLTFAEVGSTGDTITRTSGSWITDGFKVGDVVTITGTASNNVSGAIQALSATVLTFGSTDLAAEAIGTHVVSITAPAESDTDHVSSCDSTWASIDAQKRIDLALGRARKLSPITGYHFRRPAQWAVSLREYQHDVQIPAWRKADGPLSGWSLEDEEGNTVEHDERLDGGALAARFTCLRSWSNGPNGTFVALSLTRASEDSLLSRTHNLAVANVGCTVCQAATENAIGQQPTLAKTGTADEASLKRIEEPVNSALAIALLQDKGEGPRASSATWQASRDDVLNVPGAELTGTLSLLINGTIEKISTRARVQTAG